MISVLAALGVLIALGAAGVLGGLWRAAGVITRRVADLGAAPARASMFVERIRLPALLWAGGLLVLGVLIAVLGRDRAAVQWGFFAGAAFGVLAALLIPQFARSVTGGR